MSDQSDGEGGTWDSTPNSRGSFLPDSGEQVSCVGVSV